MHKNDNVALRDLKCGEKIMHKLYFVRNKVQLITSIITLWEKLLDSDWLRHCEFIRNLRANSVIRGKLQISRGKSVIHSECKYKQELRINN